MQYKVEKVENSKVKVVFTLNAKEWEESIQKAYIKNKNRYSYPGYRKGKVPRKLLEGVYGKEIFIDDAFNEAFPTYYEEVLEKEKDLYPVDNPREFDVIKIDEEGVEYSVTVITKPDVELGAYKGIKISKKEYNVEDKDIDDALKQEQDKIARVVEVEGRAAKDGDTANIDYSGSVDGVVFEGGTAEGQDLVLGSGQFIPGFEEGIIGMNKGDEKDIKVTFPKEYHSTDLAGKEAVFKIKLNAIQEKELPTLDDEFAKDVSEFETLDEYKADLRKKLQEENDKKAIREYEDELVKSIVDNAKIDIPKVMIESQIESLIKETEYRLMYQGLSLADYLKYVGISMEDFKKQHEEEAATQVKTQLVIDKIIRVEDIKADKEKVNEKIKEFAKEAKKTITEFKKTMPERQLNYIENQIVSDTLFEFLKTNNPLV